MTDTPSEEEQRQEPDTGDGGDLAAVRARLLAARRALGDPVILPGQETLF